MVSNVCSICDNVRVFLEVVAEEVEEGVELEVVAEVVEEGVELEVDVLISPCVVLPCVVSPCVVFNLVDIVFDCFVRVGEKAVFLVLFTCLIPPGNLGFGLPLLKRFRKPLMVLRMPGKTGE